jgi:hypothetical protein
MPIINSVTKVSGDLSLWFIDVEGGRLELTTDELYNNRLFILKCVNSLNMLPTPMKQEQWTAFLQQLLDKAVIITDENMFKRHEVPDQFNMFMMKRITENKDEINAGRVVYYHDKKEIHFKLEPFINFMKYKKILIDKAWVVMFFKQRGVVTAVGKDKDRKSYRYQVMQLSDDEALDIDSLLRVGEVI